MTTGSGETNALIAVSPRHSVLLADDYVDLVSRPPNQDFVIRTIARREANGLPLMRADIVIAGRDTRARFPAADRYPLHFRKVYYPARLHGDPRHEFERQTEASALIGIPAPIGYTDDTFRACLLPGTPYDRLIPFDVQPEQRAIERARDLPLAGGVGLFRLAEDAFRQLKTLHDGGLVHADAQLHNFIVCPSPVEMLLVDFEAAMRRTDVAPEAWESTCAADFDPLIRIAALLQCSLGPQVGPLAEMARDRIDRVFKDPERILAEMPRHAPRPA
jgi:hypothetical protein